MNKALAMLAALLAYGCDRASSPAAGMDHDEAAESAAEGPHGGRLLADGDFAIELAIFETGVPPEFHAWAFAAGEPLPPAEVELAVELGRLGGVVDRIGFAPAGDFLRGDSVVREPHSFDVRVRARRSGREHVWTYAAYEGRTTIAAAVAADAGIVTARASPGTIEETLLLYGAINPDTARVRDVAARFPGVVRSVRAAVGDRVTEGDALATIESNESLRVYTVTAPIDGVITERHAQPGEQIDAQQLFEIADFSRVWAELSVFPRDRARVRQGQTVQIDAEGGAHTAGTVDYLAPAGDRASQSVTVRVVLDNTDGRWTPGQFVEGRIALAETPVALAVPLSALQTFRDFDVVFARVGDVYEVRMLDLGKRDADQVEVLGGLDPGTEYVIESSYLVKADIEKAGATHDH